MSVIQRLYQSAAHFVQPDCAFCGNRREPGHNLCPACHQDLPWLPPEHITPLPDSDETLSAFAYQPPINNLLLSVKFGKNVRQLSTLGELTADGILPQIASVPDAILPVPLHRKRLYSRGFNQALELARPLARILGIPLLPQTIIRAKATLPQTELDSAQRLSNLRQAFALDQPLPYQHIVIFDDVITTGATAQELARLLRSHGIRHISVWSCARAILRQKHDLGERFNYYYT